MGSTGQAGNPRSSRSKTPTDGESSQDTGRESESSRTFEQLQPRRWQQPLRKLTEAQVAEAITLYQSGRSLGQVAAPMGVSRQAMHDLLKRRIPLRGRIEALPRKSPTALRRKRNAALKRYRARAARITAAQIMAVRTRDRVCVRCGGAGDDVDHVVPVAQGGQTVMENLQLLCEPCHFAKTGAELRKEVV